MSDAARAVTCPSCGGTVQVRAAGFSVTLVCEYCGSVLDVANPDVALIEKHAQSVAQLKIPLGSRGIIRSQEYQVLGWMRRSLGYESWEEYLLFNPYIGYRWLIDEDGDWSFGTMLSTLPDARLETRIRYDQYEDFHYAYFSNLTFDSEGPENFVVTVDAVVGEFYWRVKVGDQVETLINYQSRPYTLSSEQTGDEINWTISEPLNPHEISGFDGADFSVPVRPNAAQVLGDSLRTSATHAVGGGVGSILKIFGATAAFLILIMFVSSFGGMRPQSFNYDVVLDGASQSTTFGPLAFAGGRQKVEINTTSTDFDNAWIDLDISLVERTTQATIEAASVVEKYSGYDSDGAWSEGSRSKSTKIASVPSGTYDLVIEAQAKSWPAPQNGYGYTEGSKMTLTTTVSSGGVFFSNLLLALALLAIPPIWLIWQRMKRAGMFEGEDDD